MVGNVRNKQEAMARLGKKTVKESMRERLLGFCIRVLEK